VGAAGGLQCATLHRMHGSSSSAGDLMAVVRFADTRWLTSGWSKLPLVFERALLYSSGHLGSVYGSALARGETRHTLGGAQPDWYDVFATMAPNLDAEELAAERPDDWIVWSHEAASWSLRDGRVASRLRLELVDGDRRKVLSASYTRHNPFPEIEAALRVPWGQTAGPLDSPRGDHRAASTRPAAAPRVRSLPPSAGRPAAIPRAFPGRVPDRLGGGGARTCADRSHTSGVDVP
jgi:hypothetical protein